MKLSSLKTAVALAGALCTASYGLAAQAQEKVVRIGMTAGDIPKTHGQPDQAFEGNRLTGLTMFDALTAWDYDTGLHIIPSLAVSWEVDKDDSTKWLFHLREDVFFRDGSPFNADAVVWNVEKVLDPEAPHYDRSQVGLTLSRMPTLRTARAVDEFTVELTTSDPDSFLPINLVNLFMASPAHWEQKLSEVSSQVTDPVERSALAWVEFANDPSGTGAFHLASFVPRERLEMVRNPDYWDQDRLPKIDRIVLTPLPDVNARVAALLSDQVDWIEAPPPDALDAIRGRGFSVVTSNMAHVWPWQPSMLEGSVWLDKRVRHAANLCINRDDLVIINGGLADAAHGMLRPGHPWFGNPEFQLRFDVDEGRRLMEEAGFSQANPASVKVLIAQAGSGQMQSVPMNETMQAALSACYFDVQFELLEWGALTTNWREGPTVSAARGANTMNVSIATIDPFFALARFADSRMAPPVSNNWGYINDPKLDELVALARKTFEAGERDAVLGRIHERLVNEAFFVWAIHDVAPRALSAKITGYAAPNGYFVDWAKLDMQTP